VIGKDYVGNNVNGYEALFGHPYNLGSTIITSEVMNGKSIFPIRPTVDEFRKVELANMKCIQDAQQKEKNRLLGVGNEDNSAEADSDVDKADSYGVVEVKSKRQYVKKGNKSTKAANVKAKETVLVPPAKLVSVPPVPVKAVSARAAKAAAKKKETEDARAAEKEITDIAAKNLAAKDETITLYKKELETLRADLEKQANDEIQRSKKEFERKVAAAVEDKMMKIAQETAAAEKDLKNLKADISNFQHSKAATDGTSVGQSLIGMEVRDSNSKAKKFHPRQEASFEDGYDSSSDLDESNGNIYIPLALAIFSLNGFICIDVEHEKRKRTFSHCRKKSKASVQQLLMWQNQDHQVARARHEHELKEQIHALQSRNDQLLRDRAYDSRERDFISRLNKQYMHFFH
jgi:hypothetical protein